VADTRELVSRLIGENIELCTVLDPDLGNVLMDPTQFQQVLLNLVLNARDAMPGGGRILVRTANCDFHPTGPALPAGPVPGVMLEVIDHGCGMTAETRAHLFEPFFTTKTAGRGNGLGLATLHDIVQAAGGCIEVESQLGVGTTFRVFLPRVPDPAKPDIPDFHYAPHSAHETILVVEDNGTVRQAVRGILRECGYFVLEASTGTEALALASLHDGPIDLLLADLGLPGLSGQTMARRLRATRPDLKCLYMSAYESRPGSRKIDVEPVVLFQKPFTGAVLLQKVREILEARPPASTKNKGDTTDDIR
jgi:two-component system, cell cycle sensor histidine kinase and response regulator CckA